MKCNNAHCCDEKYLELINKFYSDIVYIFMQPSKDVLNLLAIVFHFILFQVGMIH